MEVTSPIRSLTTTKITVNKIKEGPDKVLLNAAEKLRRDLQTQLGEAP